MICSAPGCGNSAELVVRQLALCHAHYTLLRLHLHLRGFTLGDFEGDLKELLRDRCHFAEAGHS